MKRALFSFGRKYVVESATAADWFRLEIDRDDWMKKKNDWDFELTEYGDNEGEKDVGTRIEVTELLEDAARQFDLEYFRTRVVNEIRRKHGYFIDLGLAVRLSGVTIPSHKWQLFADAQFSPAHVDRTYNGGGEPVRSRIYAGVSDSNPTDAGWYVICNGRLVLSADKSEKTGWGQLKAEMDAATGTPRYHNQFARFRGYTLFDSGDAGRLPWNTTKTDIDPDNSIWRAVREEMALAMRPVIDFLNNVDGESEQPATERPLTAALAGATIKSIADVRAPAKFSFPKQPRPSGPKMVNIHFRKEKDRVDALQDAMGTTSARDTAAAAFEKAYTEYVQGK